ncbi:Hypothetical_protein [Hexamita inflata]|uniref:Hypothetical_protein n=1 Tax=Hexamita inflata TaxID=28002 RepID=A0AA86RLR9_9EUKA|nr:Hypothetical protein HINF_LOCUS62019 [Hexamita inflata]
MESEWNSLQCSPERFAYGKNDFGYSMPDPPVSKKRDPELLRESGIIFQYAVSKRRAHLHSMIFWLILYYQVQFQYIIVYTIRDRIKFLYNSVRIHNICNNTAKKIRTLLRRLEIANIM